MLDVEDPTNDARKARRMGGLRLVRHLLLLGSVLVAALWSTSLATAAPGQPVRLPGGLQYVLFQPTDEELLNPGRGLQRSYEEEIGTWQFVHHDETTPRRQMYLPVMEGALPDGVLEGVRRDLRWAVERGVLVDLRFAYAYDLGGAEPSYSTILLHQQQLAPIVHEYAFVLNTLGLGLIGPWGEQHSVTAAGFNEGDDAGAYPKRLQLLRGWLDGAPPGLVVTLRYPHQLRWMIEQGGLTASEVAMTGIYNDGFLANNHHEGTFRSPRGDAAEIEQDKRWLEEFTQTHPSRAESNVSPDGPAEYANTGTNWLTDGFARYRIDTLREWGLAQGLHERTWAEVRRNLGYRLVLEGVMLPERAYPGQRISIYFAIKNEGYAPPRRERLIVLRFGDQQALVEGVDARGWGPGSHTVSGTVTVPSLGEGAYELSLGLSDPTPALRANPRYAIRLASRDVWDGASGTNRLGAMMTVLN